MGWLSDREIDRPRRPQKVRRAILYRRLVKVGPPAHPSDSQGEHRQAQGQQPEQLSGNEAQGTKNS